MSPGAGVRQVLESRIAAGWMPGACWCFEDLRAGRRFTGATGAAALIPRPEPASGNRPYDLASLTKPLATAPLALMLAQEGLLDLNSPVEEHLRVFASGPYAASTVLDLATHRAGFPAWRPLYLEASDLAGYLAAIARVPPAVARGEELYSDLGYIVLGAIVERVEGESLARCFARRIARVLELETTGYAVAGGREDAVPTELGNLYEREMAGDADRGYRWRSHVLRGEAHDANAHGLGGVAGHAGLFGTVDEVGTICRELVQPGRLPLAPASRERMLQATGAGARRTFGMVLAGHAAAARGALPYASPGHTGFTGTSIWLEPEARRLYVLLANRVHPSVQLRGFDPVRNAFHRAARERLEAG